MVDDLPPRRASNVRVPATLVVLLLSLVVTFGVWASVNMAVEEREHQRFEGAIAEMEGAIAQRMDTYLNALRDSAGFMHASQDVTRDEWQTYITSLELKRRYPGIQGIGYTVRVPASQRAAHERSVRAEGFSAYRIWPTYRRDEYFSIVYLEPFDWRNQRAFGYDMYSEPVRREAMARARDTGAPALSGRVKLVQETAVRPQAGFLIYVPVYQRGMPLATVEQRRAALLGFVYSPFRADDLFKGIFGRKEARPVIDVEIFDTRQPSASDLLHDHHPGAPSPERPRFEEVRVLDIAGRPWTLRFSSLPAFEAEGNRELPPLVLLTGLVVSALLVWITWVLATGRERALALANEMTLELRQADRAKDEFLSVISHELRTPLNFIMGFASILNDEVAGPMNPEQHGYMGKILNGVDRMLILVNDLLDFAKMQAGKFDLTLTEAPYAPLIEELVVTMRPLADEKKIALTARGGDGVSLPMDQRRVLQVLTNLVGNAIKFTPEGGTIHVEARVVGDRMLTEITDSGIGIAPEDLPKLFTRFRQLDMSSTRQAGGTGLGLSISKAIVEAHGGEIGVRSQKGVGSVFWFSLPLDDSRGWLAHPRSLVGESEGLS